ncbi:MAG: hypothetical protein PVS2B2_25060 [Candidatus Acidiferrum sp.]
MRDRIRCSCQSCTIRNLMGPAILITIGLLFLFDQMRGGALDFSNTFPVILIVIGAVLLASALTPKDGHAPCASSAVPPAGPSAIPPPGPGAPQTPESGQGI